MPSNYTPPVNLASPPPIGDTTPNTVAATTLTSTVQILVAPGTNSLPGYSLSGFPGSGISGGDGIIYINTGGSSGPQRVLTMYAGAAYSNVHWACNNNATFDLGVSGAIWRNLFFAPPTSDPAVTGQTWSKNGNLLLSGATAQTLILDTGWTANADSGSKTASIPANSGTIQAALNVVSPGAGDAFVAVQSKVKAIEAALVGLLLPSA